MAYPLHSLLSVRHLREKTAHAAWLKADHLVRDAQEELERCKEELARYQRWLPQEIDRRYAAIMGTAMHLRDLDQFKAGIATLNAGTVLRQEKILQAEQHLNEQKAQRETARQALMQARKEHMKLTTHQDIWTEQEQLELERKEENEQDELASQHPLSSPGQESEDK